MQPVLALVPFRDLTERSFPELCGANLIVRDRGLIALTSGFPLLSWPGRAIYDGRRLVQRVALYDDHHQRLGVFDDARYHINDVAFHPTDPVLAIATGEYDGGYFFEGELWLWNWQTGERRELESTRETLRCRFEPDGLLTIAVQPIAETDQSYYGLTFDPRTTVTVDPHDLVVCRLADFGFDDDLEGREQANAIARGELGIEHRAVIWDLAWTFDGRIAVARDDGHVELWSSTGKREHVIRIGGNVVQLLRQPAQLLVHVSGARSELHVLRGNQLELWMELPEKYTCSVDAAGRILARQVEGGRQDLLVTASKEILVQGDLGHYDVFNHFLRIDGAEELFLLRGTPMTSHEHKRLCAIGPGDIVAIPELAWDTDGEHRMTGSAVMLDEDFVCSYRVHQSPGGGAIRIERRTRFSGEVVWRHDVRAAASALIAWPAVGGVVAALIDGSLCVLDGDGGVLLDEPFEIDGVRTIPTALLVHEETLIVGTIDGRISMRSLR